MADTKQKLHSVNVGESVDAKVDRPSEAIASRKSRELVIAFAGPVGCGINTAKEHVTDVLKSSGYVVHEIKISEYLVECLKNKVVPSNGVVYTSGFERYIQMQDTGNLLRNVQGDILAEYAIKKIAEIRTADIPKEIEDVTTYVPERVAYLIDQLKHPDEVALLRAVYGNLFYLFGVLSVSARREGRLKTEGIEPTKISELVERDRKQLEKHGQQLDKALQLADFFIRNDHANVKAIEDQIRRFVDLIHGANGITPSREEYGMYMAYAAGLRSACLSRQVGASIMNPQGSIISTGRNDVPKAGGGLYGPEHGTGDARCVKLENATCFNDLYKNKLKDEIGLVIKKKLAEHIGELKAGAKGDQLTLLDGISPNAWAADISEAAHHDTRLGGLIEFSRSIHAEMDAIVSLARLGGGSTEGATLFTYTFPCHNCARHIVAAGISRVYFLEPYEKSLASELHSDAIDIDGQSGSLGTGNASDVPRVQFLHFEGVAPRQYLNMFTPAGDRKDPKTGKAVSVNVRIAEKKVPEYLDDYREYELKVVEHLSNIISELGCNGLPAGE